MPGALTYICTLKTQQNISHKTVDQALVLKISLTQITAICGAWSCTRRPPRSSGWSCAQRHACLVVIRNTVVSHLYWRCCITTFAYNSRCWSLSIRLHMLWCLGTFQGPLSSLVSICLTQKLGRAKCPQIREGRGSGSLMASLKVRNSLLLKHNPPHPHGFPDTHDLFYGEFENLCIL